MSGKVERRAWGKVNFVALYESQKLETELKNVSRIFLRKLYCFSCYTIDELSITATPSNIWRLSRAPWLEACNSQFHRTFFCVLSCLLRRRCDTRHSMVPHTAQNNIKKLRSQNFSYGKNPRFASLDSRLSFFFAFSYNFSTSIKIFLISSREMKGNVLLFWWHRKLSISIGNDL